MQLNLSEYPSYNSFSLNHQKKSQAFLTVRETKNYLQSKKIVPKDRSEALFSTPCKTATICVVLFGTMSALLALLDVSNKNAYIDHSHDKATDYQFIPGPYNISMPSHDGFLPNKDHFFVDHTLDKWVPSLSEGLKAGIPVLAVPLFLIFVCWATDKISSRILSDKEKKDALEHNEKIDDLIIYLNVSYPNLEETELPSKFIKKLMKYDLCISELLVNLSFSQLKSIRSTNKELFDQLLNQNEFSETQKEYFARLKLMIEATETELGLALAKDQDNNLIESEPLFLEILIQEIENEHFTNQVQGLLTNKLRLIDDELQRLEKDELIKIVQLIHEYKYSIEKAYHVCKSNLLKDDKEICFTIINEEKREISDPISVNLLCNSSDVFKNMLKGKFKESEEKEITLQTIDIKSFNAVLSYLKHDIIDINPENIFDILEIANLYNLKKLHLLIEKRFCKDVKSYIKNHELEDVLNMAKDYGLLNFKETINLTIAKMLPDIFSSDFDELIRVSTEFNLTEALTSCSKIISSDIETISQNEKFITKLVSIAKVNQSLFESTFPSFKDLLNTKPQLLKKLWDEALNHNVKAILDLIEVFNKNPENLHIFLRNWDVPPTVKTKSLSLNSIELEFYI